MESMGIANSTHIIFGLGQSGLSCARYFDRIGQNYCLLDTREIPPGINEVKNLKNCQAFYFGKAFNFESIDESLLSKCQQLVVSPGISLSHSLIVTANKLNIDICGDVELFVRASNKNIIAITGSNGKSTVTDLTDQLLNAAGINSQKGGNIGLPVLDFLPQDEADIYVFELSSFQLDTTSSLKAKVAVLLNVSEDHMDRYNYFSEYHQSKLTIFNNTEMAVYNDDDELTCPLDSPAARINKTFSVKKSEGVSAWIKKSSNYYDLMVNNRKIISSEFLNITGKHNLANVLASLNILNALNVTFSDSVLKKLQSYKGLKHRFQLVKRDSLCEWINDSKATNVGATVAAINGIQIDKSTPLILIAGGDSKNSDLTDLIKPLEQKVSALILLGKDAKQIASLTSKVVAYFVENMQQAVLKAKELVSSGGIVLLSPACASLDMYKNFEDRGDEFINAVGLLA